MQLNKTAGIFWFSMLVCLGISWMLEGLQLAEGYQSIAVAVAFAIVWQYVSKPKLRRLRFPFSARHGAMLYWTLLATVSFACVVLSIKSLQGNLDILLQRNMEAWNIGMLCGSLLWMICFELYTKGALLTFCEEQMETGFALLVVAFCSAMLCSTGDGVESFLQALLFAFFVYTVGTVWVSVWAHLVYQGVVWIVSRFYGTYVMFGMGKYLGMLLLLVALLSLYLVFRESEILLKKEILQLWQGKGKGLRGMLAMFLHPLFGCFLFLWILKQALS